MKDFTDNQLIVSLDKVVRRERELLTDVLNHFKEFDRRKLFSKLGYSSLHEYAVKHLKYSDDQAYRRVQAMRLLRDIPEIEIKIEEGALTLSSLSQAQSYFRKVEHNKEEKREILQKLRNATKREAQKIFQQEDKVRYSFEADSGLEKVIEELKGLHPHLTFDQLSKKVWEFAFEKLRPASTRAVMKPREKIIDDRMQECAQNKTQNRDPYRDLDPDRDRDQTRNNARYISVNVKREVWFKAAGKCQNCRSTFALEYDHIVPFAKGGLSTKENLRLLCRSCNQRKAIEHYGIQKMETFLRSESTVYLA